MEQIDEQIKDVDDEAGELDAPGSTEPQDDDAEDADASDAYRQFLADRRSMRYEDNADNKRKLVDFLLKFSPPLPETPAAFYLAFDELRKDDKLELIPFAPPKSPEMRTAGEVKEAELKERAEPRTDSASDVGKDASAMSKMFKRQSEMVRYKNGRKIGAQSG